MAKIQYLGIKYPFTNNEFQNFFLDVNETEQERIRSQIMHVIFTPKGQRIREPEFGTDLIKFIFEPNEEVTWDGLKNEIIDAVQTYVDNVILNDIQVAKSEENDTSVYVRIDYSIKQGNKLIKDSIVTEL
nr:MAG TPA: Baseplate wedge protein [Caudoviricetes sp.]